ncbi:MAG: glycyl-radical enzyme activating protein [Smithella sp.]|jgi:pyruvate formate lyase activating enzyme|nr:glycyl-radical enzyme activating protein [Syntrophaceae bacterium]
MKESVLITDIAKFSVNDGPGFRTNVFLKGCPLRCEWCHNPETIPTYPEVYWKKRLCVQCGACMEACPRDAINPPIEPELANIEGSNYHKIDRAKCDNCLKCIDACKYDALELVGKTMSVSEVIDVVEQDKPFYKTSGGGMTLSGGEPTMHPAFSLELLKEAKRRVIHTCVDTNGYCNFSILEEMAEYTDIFLFDLKHLDSAKHFEKTGVKNELILKNLELLCKKDSDIWVRIPVIPGFNDDIDFHTKASVYLASLTGNIKRVDLIPFHNYCQDKYSWLGRKWSYSEIDAVNPSFLEIHADLYRQYGLVTTVGGSGFEETDTAKISRESQSCKGSDLNLEE